MVFQLIICGAGKTGKYVISELVKAKEDFVVADTDPEKIKGLSPNVIFIEGDVTHDSVLRDAGIEKAKGLVATLPTDAKKHLSGCYCKEFKSQPENNNPVS